MLSPLEDDNIFLATANVVVDRYEARPVYETVSTPAFVTSSTKDKHNSLNGISTNTNVFYAVV